MYIPGSAKDIESTLGAYLQSSTQENMVSVKKISIVVLVGFVIVLLFMVYSTQNRDRITIADSTVKEVRTQVNRHMPKMKRVQSRVPKYMTSLFKYDTKRRSFELNITRSMEIPVDRKIPSTVSKECSSVEYSFKPITVSVIIPFYAEHWTILLRLLHCVLDTVPDDILHQVILVDDANEELNLEDPLEEYIQSYSKVSLIRLKERHGLIKARMVGARASSGDVLVFIDAHVEMEAGWLEPLLQVISENNNTVAVPQIRNLHPDTLEPWSVGGMSFGSFSWELDYVWMTVPSEVLHAAQSRSSPNSTAAATTAAITEPIPTATMIGCLFAAHRERFFALGGLDEAMEVWGGENLEVSFRTWMCGGRVLLVPCARAYHVFRGHLPYAIPGDALFRNLQRVAAVWMDDYQLHYYHSVEKAAKFSADDKKSLARRQDLRRRLQCHDFQWYLKNIAPNILEPPRLAVLWGQLKNLKLPGCLGSRSQYNKVGFSDCMMFQPFQTFYFNTDSQIVHQQSGRCLERAEDGTTLRLQPCKLFQQAQTWNYNPIYPDTLKRYIYGVDSRKPIGTFWMRNVDSERVCLDYAVTSQSHSPYPVLQTCAMDRLQQYWLFLHKINDHIYPGDAFS